MKKKGFTLVELLAVIVILAFIVLIATPIILNVIEDAKKGSAENSALGYIDALEKQLMVNELNSKIVEDKQYLVSELEVNYSGTGPSNGIVYIESKTIKSARLCFGKYSINYDGSKAKIVDNNYCSNDFEVILNVNGTEKTKKNIGITTNTEIEINEDISTLTNISCSNSAIPTVEGNTLKINNIFGDTVCNINSSLKETITKLDNTETNIVMLADETLTNYLTIKKEKNVILDLNGKAISSSTMIFSNIGNLKIFSINNQGTLSSGVSVINSNEGSKTILDNIKIVSTNTNNSSAICNNGYLEVNGNSYIEGAFGIGCHSSNSAMTVINDSVIKGTINHGIALNTGYTSKLIINSGYIYGKKTSVCHWSLDSVQINGGVFIGETSNAIYNAGNGTVNINQTNEPIYISSLADAWKPAILNSSTKDINITGNIANECTSDYTKTISGLCVYAGGINEETGNGAVQNNNSGTMNINGGTYYGSKQGINNGSTGNINIVNVQISAGVSGILNNKSGIVNICNSTIYSAVQDLYKTGQVGTINYSNDVIFTDGTNTPVIGGSTVNINPNYTGTCLGQ